MYWRRFEVSKIPLSSLEEFDDWLKDRWLEKDDLLRYHAQHQRFPSSLPDQKCIKTGVRLDAWWEIWRIFILLIVVGIALALKSLLY